MLFGTASSAAGNRLIRQTAGDDVHGYVDSDHIAVVVAFFGRAGLLCCPLCGLGSAAGAT